MVTKKPIVVDLFCGAGGMSEGFKQAGFYIIAANEIVKSCIETYKLNHKGTKVFLKDIRKISVEEFKTECGINGKKIDVLIGGPPCQGFSNANRQRFIDDPRNILYKYFVKFVKEINPTFFIMENVKGMKNISAQITEDFKKIGYTTKYEVLNAKDYGVPQNRERIFFIGTNLNNNFWEDLIVVDKIIAGIIQNKSEKIVPLSDALWGLRSLKPLPNKNMTAEESEEYGFTEDKIIKKSEKVPEYILRINNGQIPNKVYNHKTRFNNKRDIEIFRRLPQGGKSDHPSIQDIMPYKNREHIFKDKFFKLVSDMACKTITAHMKFDCHMYIHPFEARGLTPREAARVQGFPDNYMFQGPFTSWYMQVGNAVPPPLACIIAKSILTRIHPKNSKAKGEHLHEAEIY